MDAVEGRHTVLCNVGEVDERELSDRVSHSPPLYLAHTLPFLLRPLFPTRLNTQPYALTIPRFLSFGPVHELSLLSSPSIALLAPLEALCICLSLSLPLSLSLSSQYFRLDFASIHETASRESVSLGKY